MNTIKTMRAILAICLICIAFYSCREKLTPLQYAVYMEDPENGLKVTRNVNGFDFILQYEPIDYKIVKAYRGKIISSSVLQEERMNYDSLQYYVLKIKGSSSDLLKQDVADEAAYYARLQYLSAAVQQDLYVIEGKDSLACVLSHFERDYSLSPYVTLVLGFEEKKCGDENIADKVFVYDDHAFGNGIVKIQVKSDDIKNIPALITE